MPNKKIKELTNLNNILPADAVAIQSGNVTHHTTVSALQSHMLKDVLKRLEALENKGGASQVYMSHGYEAEWRGNYKVPHQQVLRFFPDDGINEEIHSFGNENQGDVGFTITSNSQFLVICLNPEGIHGNYNGAPTNRTDDRYTTEAVGLLSNGRHRFVIKDGPREPVFILIRIPKGQGYDGARGY